MEGIFMNGRQNKGRIFILSAPSGAGKTSLTNYIIPILNKEISIKRVVTYTTRSPRAGEIDGTDYHFITRDDFLQKIQSGFFLEHTTYDKNHNGSPQSIVNDLITGLSYIMVVDRPGAKNLFRLIENPVLIWITVSNKEILKTRLQKRASETHEQIENRIKIATREFEQEQQEHFFTYHVVNDVFEDAAQELIDIIKKELPHFNRLNRMK